MDGPAKFDAPSSTTIQLGVHLSFIKSALKTGIMIKVIQAAKRELNKPENQRKIKDGLGKLQKARRR